MYSKSQTTKKEEKRRDCSQTLYETRVDDLKDSQNKSKFYKTFTPLRRLILIELELVSFCLKLNFQVLTATRLSLFSVQTLALMYACHALVIFCHYANFKRES